MVNMVKDHVDNEVMMIRLVK